jgi:hypothetical protein
VICDGAGATTSDTNDVATGGGFNSTNANFRPIVSAALASAGTLATNTTTAPRGWRATNDGGGESFTVFAVCQSVP